MSEVRVISLRGVASLALFAVALFALFNLLDGADYLHAAAYQLRRRDIANPLYNTGVYSVAYFLCIAGLVVLYLHGNRVLRYLALAISAIAVALDAGFRSFNGYGFTYHEASLIWSEKEFIGDALVQGLGTYLLPAALCVAAVVTFERFARPRLPVLRSWLWLAIPIAAGWVYLSLLERTYAKVYQVPMPYRVAMLTEHTYRHQLLFYGKREPPEFAPSGPALADHILMIVDESVTGDMLGINGAEADTTPFLDSIPDKILNYGVASAPSNLSSTSNIIMQSGLRVDQVPDRDLRALKNPNVFSYMKAAGFSTALIDAQIYSDKPTNLMTGFDLEALDAHLFVRVAEVSSPEHEMDLRAMDHATAFIESHERTFVYLVKAGAHFPYDPKYPPDQAFFQPTLSSGGLGNNLEKTLQSYRNALRYTVDAFLQRLMLEHERRGTSLVVVYTADHGQSLHASVKDDGPSRSGRPKGWPHAVPVDPPPQQASVPLILFATEPGVRSALRARFPPGLVGRASAFEVFPTLLELAGFDPTRVRARYGPSLFDGSPRPPRRFVSGNLFGRGGGFYQNELIREAGFLNDFD